MPSQKSLTDQLADLLDVCQERGLYDAADFIRNHVERVNEKCEAPVRRIPVDLGYVSDVFGDAPIAAADKDGLNIVEFYFECNEIDDDLIAIVRPPEGKVGDYPCVWDAETKQWEPF